MSKDKCLQSLAEKCKTANHVITKVLRITTGSLESLLKQRNDVKIIHLFRNPLAIINSRMATRSYPVSSYEANAKTLCKKMKTDYNDAIALKEIYPNRVKIVFYEDIKSSVDEKMKKLYRFINMDYSTSAVENLDTVKANKGKVSDEVQEARAQDNAHWWRTQLSYDQYRTTFDSCTYVARIFNITNYSSKYMYEQSSLPDMTLPEHLII